MSGFSKGSELPDNFKFYDVQIPSYSLAINSTSVDNTYEIPSTRRSFSFNPNKNLAVVGAGSSWAMWFSNMSAKVLANMSVDSASLKIDYSVDDTATWNGIGSSQLGVSGAAFLNKVVAIQMNNNGSGFSDIPPFTNSKIWFRASINAPDPTTELISLSFIRVQAGLFLI